MFQGKFGYLAQSSIIPQATLKAIQSITYKFIWRAQKEVSWASMIKKKDQGEIDVRDYKSTHLASIIGRACKMRESDGV